MMEGAPYYFVRRWGRELDAGWYEVWRRNADGTAEIIRSFPTHREAWAHKLELAAAIRALKASEDAHRT